MRSIEGGFSAFPVDGAFFRVVLLVQLGVPESTVRRR